MILLPKNPFKNQMMRRQFDACVHCYNIRHKDLITERGTRHKGNIVASYFWRGYDRFNRKSWDKQSRQMVAWASYRAGEAIRGLVERNNMEIISKGD